MLPQHTDVGAPDLVDPQYWDVTQKVRENTMLHISLGQPWLGINRLQAHQPHETLDALPVEIDTVGGPQPFDNLSAAVERSVCVLLVN